MLIHPSIQKPIHRVRRGDIVERKIGIRLLSMAVKLRALRRWMTKGMAKLAPDILPKRACIRPLLGVIIPFVLLQITLPSVIIGRTIEPTVIIPWVVVVTVVVVSQTTIITPPTTIRNEVVVKRTRGLALCNKGWWWLSQHGQ